MSRHAQLPPRCPLQKKPVAPIANFSIPPPSSKDFDLHPEEYGHYTTASQGSISEEQLPWLNDLLSDSDSSSNGASHHGAASDSSTLLDGLVSLQNLDRLYEKETEDSCGQGDDGLVSTCTYGPNSPRRKDNLCFPRNEIASAFPEYVMQNPLQNLVDNNSVSELLQSDPFGDAGALDQNNFDNKSVKRHPGQRSRARKLQYISELEKTVDVLQNLGSDLAVRVASLIQQYTALSMENNTLKQKLLRSKQHKFVVDGEYLSLKKELERLRTGMAAVSTNNKNHNWPRSAANYAHSDVAWNMLDLRKLDLH